MFEGGKKEGREDLEVGEGVGDEGEETDEGDVQLLEKKRQRIG